MTNTLIYILTVKYAEKLAFELVAVSEKLYPAIQLIAATASKQVLKYFKNSGIEF
ncbi:hypothetical protein H6G04_21505 [Calothrix membranacea FACHB-236]|nr:hypothetical protein [Calothrix membranacea FACHB-236]